MAIEFHRCKGCSKPQRSDHVTCQFCGAEILTGVMPTAKVSLDDRMTSIINASLIIIQEWLSRPKSKKLIASCAIITLLLGGVLYWRWVRSPQYSLWQVKKAFEQHDLHTFKKYVDVEGFSSRLIDQLLEHTSSRSPESTDARSKLGEALAGGIVKMAKPRFITMMKERIHYYVEKGNFEAVKQGKGGLETIVNKLIDGAGNARTKFKGIKYVKKEGKIALVGLRIFYPEYNSFAIIDVKMRELGGYWQVAELSNLDTFLETFAKLEARAKGIRAKHAQKNPTVVVTAHAADFSAGVNAYNRGDYATALRIFRQLADQGNAHAQFNLGLMYEQGQGVTQDYAEAMRWYHKAAKQGFAGAQLNLGVMYDNGQGVPQDYAEAMRWFRKAADQGNADAERDLGVMYKKGQGVAQDYAAALRWYRKAADQGNARAQTSLGVMYYNGWGVAQDYVQAHMWYNLGAARGSDEIEKASSMLRDFLVEKMTPEQIAEAQRLAREWKPKGK